MFPLANPQFLSVVDSVPDENIGKNLEELCIRRGNLKYLDDEIADANLKKIGNPHMLAGSFLRLQINRFIHTAQMQILLGKGNLNFSFPKTPVNPLPS